MNMSDVPFSLARGTSPAVYQTRERVGITVRLEPKVVEALFYASAKRKRSLRWRLKEVSPWLT
jgi:hypothetical protein